MASLNLSINGPSIKSSYNGVVNGPPPSSDSPTYAHWALFSVQAPLMSAFQDSGAKESILKVQSTGDGELADLIEDFSEGRIQFAFARVKDPNSGLPKSILIAWCGEGVPERTKGYFTSHLAAVSKVLHGYHVQITARSERDLEVDSIMQKVADASGAKYSAASSDGPRSSAPPPVKTKPVFTPTTSSRANPIVAARSKKDDNVDEDGWGADAPPVTRSQIEKVESAYKPTKVNIADLSKQPTATTSGSAPVKPDDTPSDVVKGGYQPVGKVDIAALRAQAQKDQDDRPTPVKGSYEPVGKVDIAAIRAKAKKPAASEEPQDDETTRPVSERMAAFSQPSQSERMTSLPKPKVANKFGGAASFSGTKAPTPGGLGFGAPAPEKSAPIGAASRTFADQGGKTPAQLWAERKARERGESVGSNSAPTPAPAAAGSASPVQAQKSGNEWKSGYSGKSWAPVQTGDYGRGIPGQISQENTGEQNEDTPASPSGVSALRDRFKDTIPISAGAPPPPAARPAQDDDSPLPPVPGDSRPSGGFALPGLPNRPVPKDEQSDDEREDPSAYQTAAERGRSPSPPRVAVPVSRGPEPDVGTPPEQRAPPPIPPSQIDVPKESELADDKEVSSTARFAGGAAAGLAVGAAAGVGAAAAAGAFDREPSPEPQPEPEPERAPSQAPPQAAQPAQEAQGGYRAVIQYDYEKAEDNEIELVEGDIVTNIEMVDEDWWMGTNSRGESGLFPSNYVELIGDDEPEQPASAAAPPPPVPAAEPEPEPQAPAAAQADAGHTAVALYDYEAAEDNELSFPEDATITNLEFPDEDWWFGQYNGQTGLFPANYVQLNQ
ncbi:actin binding protein [Fusarium equiseti]|uniref:Actin binding protein n=1 Tax=Fusarium equiseti TaxID=61235 RepID=A0ABQ8RAR1_FUSEQ|nr:actin binding protein [Fusarium equiseti]